MIGTAILEIVARDGSDDDMFQLHPAHRCGHALRFIFFQDKWSCCRHRAKSAGARAPLTCNHEGGRSLAPAFPAIRTLRALANSVYARIGNERSCRTEYRN